MRSVRAAIVLLSLGAVGACGGGGGGAGGGSGGGGGGGSPVNLYLGNYDFAISPFTCVSSLMFTPEGVVAFEIFHSGTTDSATGEITLASPLYPGANPRLLMISLPNPGQYWLRAKFSSGVLSPQCDGQFFFNAGDTEVAVFVSTPVHP